MDRIKRVEVRRFEIKPSNSQTVIVVEFDEFIDTGTLGTTEENWQFRRKSYRTDTGRPVQAEDDGSFSLK